MLRKLSSQLACDACAEVLVLLKSGYAILDTPISTRLDSMTKTGHLASDKQCHVQMSLACFEEARDCLQIYTGRAAEVTIRSIAPDSYRKDLVENGTYA